jgi:hypothetical protein
VISLGNCSGQATCTVTANQTGGKATVTVAVTDSYGNQVDSKTARVIVVKITGVVAGIPAMQNSTTTMNFTAQIAQDSQGGLAWPDPTTDQPWKTFRHLTLVQGSTSLITLNVYSTPLADDPDLAGKILVKPVQAPDDLNAGSPQVTPPTNEDDDSIQVNIVLSSPGTAQISGSYQVLVFVENSGGSTWKAGDTGVTVPLILVQATLHKNLTTSPSNQVTYLPLTGPWGASTTLATVATGYNSDGPRLCTAYHPDTCAILLGASVDLVGGGAAGLRGTSEVFGGWVHNANPPGLRGDLQSWSALRDGGLREQHASQRDFPPGHIASVSHRPPS